MEGVSSIFSDECGNDTSFQRIQPMATSTLNNGNKNINVGTVNETALEKGNTYSSRSIRKGDHKLRWSML